MAKTLVFTVGLELLREQQEALWFLPLSGGAAHRCHAFGSPRRRRRSRALGEERGWMVLLLSSKMQGNPEVTGARTASRLSVGRGQKLSDLGKRGGITDPLVPASVSSAVSLPPPSPMQISMIMGVLSTRSNLHIVIECGRRRRRWL